MRIWILVALVIFLLFASVPHAQQTPVNCATEIGHLYLQAVEFSAKNQELQLRVTQLETENKKLKGESTEAPKK